MARVPLPIKEFPLRSSDRTGNARLESVHAFEERAIGLDRGLADCREIEPTNRPRERVDMKIAFEEATRVGDRQEPGRSSVSPEAVNGIPRGADGPYDVRQDF